MKKVTHRIFVKVTLKVFTNLFLIDKKIKSKVKSNRNSTLPGSCTIEKIYRDANVESMWSKVVQSKRYWNWANGDSCKHINQVQCLIKEGGSCYFSHTVLKIPP